MFDIQFDVVVLELLDDTRLGEAVGRSGQAIVLEFILALIIGVLAIDGGSSSSVL